MNSSKSEDSALPSNLSGSPVSGIHENIPAKKTKPTYESTNFSAPSVDQLNGILPDFNNRLSPERNLGLSPAGHLRLGTETHPRLVSISCAGLSSLQVQEVLPQKLKVPVGKGLEIKPDPAGRSLAGVKTSSFIGADLPIAPLGSRIVTLVATEEKQIITEKKNER
jgi:hypothetical protein